MRAAPGHVACRAGAVAVCALAIAGVGCGSSDEEKQPSRSKSQPFAATDAKRPKGSGPSAAEVGAAAGRLHTARFAGTATTMLQSGTSRVDFSGRIDRDRIRSRVLATSRIAGRASSTEYRVLGDTAYFRELSPKRGPWTRQDLSRSPPGGSVVYAVASGGIFGFPLSLVDPVRKIARGSVRGATATQYRAKVKSDAGTVRNITAPTAPVSIWLDPRLRMRRLRFSTASQDAQVGTVAEQVSLDLFALNRPVEVDRPR